MADQKDTRRVIVVVFYSLLVLTALIGGVAAANNSEGPSSARDTCQAICIIECFMRKPTCLAECMERCRARPSPPVTPPSPPAPPVTPPSPPAPPGPPPSPPETSPSLDDDSGDIGHGRLSMCTFSCAKLNCVKFISDPNEQLKCGASCYKNCNLSGY